MTKHTITKEMVERFEHLLIEEERSKATISKYLHDVNYFIRFVEEQVIDKELVLKYKEGLMKDYKISSANSMLAAVNSFLHFLGWEDCCVKQFKVQKEVYCSDCKEKKTGKVIMADHPYLCQKILKNP